MLQVMSSLNAVKHFLAFLPDGRVPMLTLPLVLIYLGFFADPFLSFLLSFRFLTYVLLELLELLAALVLLLLADAPDALLAVPARRRQSVTACNGNRESE